MTIAQRIGTVAARINADTERRSWHRAIAAQALAAKYKNDASTVANKIAKDNWPDDARAQQLITRGAVTQTTTTGGYPTHDPVVTYRSLAPNSAALALFQLGLALNFEGASTIRVPSVVKASLPPSIFVEEGKAAPSVEWDFTSLILGPVKKILMMSAVSEELESCTPETASAVIGRVLADIANRGIDARAFGSADPDAANPAGLLRGVAAITAATAGLDAMAQDLANLTGAIGAAGIDPTGAVFVAGPREATIIKTKAGSKFDNPVLTTLGLPAKSVACFAPAGVVSGYQDAPTVEFGKSPAIHMVDTAPTDLSTAGAPPVVAFPVKSHYQAASISIRVRANCAWAVAPGAAQVITAVNW